MLPYPSRRARAGPPRGHPGAEGWLSLPRESELTVADRQALGNVVQGLQQVVDSPAATRVTERELLRALLRRAEAILDGGAADGA
jgi:hypothetical protein